MDSELSAAYQLVEADIRQRIEAAAVESAADGRYFRSMLTEVLAAAAVPSEDFALLAKLAKQFSPEVCAAVVIEVAEQQASAPTKEDTPQ